MIQSKLFTENYPDAELIGKIICKFLDETNSILISSTWIHGKGILIFYKKKPCHIKMDYSLMKLSKSNNLFIGLTLKSEILQEWYNYNKWWTSKSIIQGGEITRIEYLRGIPTFVVGFVHFPINNFKNWLLNIYNKQNGK